MHMIGDHHGQTAGRATLQVTATEEILGTHRRRDTNDHDALLLTLVIAAAHRQG